MPKHQLFVDLDLTGVEVMKKDVVFKIYQEGEKFGELRLSQGSVVWRGRGDKIGRKIGWNRFNRVMQEEGRRAERRPPGSKISVAKQKRT